MKVPFPASPGFFRSLSFLYKERALILRSPEPLTKRQRELMAVLFDQLAKNADECATVVQRLKDLQETILNGKSDAGARRDRINDRLNVLRKRV